MLTCRMIPRWGEGTGIFAVHPCAAGRQRGAACCSIDEGQLAVKGHKWPGRCALSWFTQRVRSLIAHPASSVPFIPLHRRPRTTRRCTWWTCMCSAAWTPSACTSRCARGEGRLHRCDRGSVTSVRQGCACIPAGRPAAAWLGKPGWAGLGAFENRAGSGHSSRFDSHLLAPQHLPARLPSPTPPPPSDCIHVGGHPRLRDAAGRGHRLQHDAALLLCPGGMGWVCDGGAVSGRAW